MSIENVEDAVLNVPSEPEDSLEKSNLLSVKKRALRILGQRNMSESGMYKRLIAKGESESDADKTVKWLVSLGYINDEEYATLICNHYTQKGYGEAKIREELNKRGIAREIRDEKLAQLREIPPEEKPDAALIFLKKKLRGSNPDDKEVLRRAKDALVRRGFGYEEAGDAVRRYVEEHSGE